MNLGFGQDVPVYNITIKLHYIILKDLFSVQNKKQVGTADGIVFWEFLKLACKSVPYNCIQKINLMDNVKTIRGKVIKIILCRYNTDR